MPSNHLILCHSLRLPLSLFQHQGFFQWVGLFASGSQSIGASASASVLPMNIQDWFPLEWTGWIPLQSKGLSRVFSNTTVQKHQFFYLIIGLYNLIFFLPYNIVLVLPYINMHLPWVYTCSLSWTPVPPPSHRQSRFDAGYRKLGAGALGWQRDGRGKEVGVGFRMGNTCTPMADACWCKAKSIQYCKVKK